MVEISSSGSGGGRGRVASRGYPTIDVGAVHVLADVAGRRFGVRSGRSDARGSAGRVRPTEARTTPPATHHRRRCFSNNGRAAVAEPGVGFTRTSRRSVVVALQLRLLLARQLVVIFADDFRLSRLIRTSQSLNYSFVSSRHHLRHHHRRPSDPRPIQLRIATATSRPRRSRPARHRQTPRVPDARRCTTRAPRRTAPRCCAA
jgi:hypothetical protein